MNTPVVQEKKNMRCGFRKAQTVTCFTADGHLFLRCVTPPAAVPDVAVYDGKREGEERREKRMEWERRREG